MWSVVAPRPPWGPVVATVEGREVAVFGRGAGLMAGLMTGLMTGAPVRDFAPVAAATGHCTIARPAKRFTGGEGDAVREG